MDPFERPVEFPGQIAEADIMFNPAALFSTNTTTPPRLAAIASTRSPSSAVSAARPIRSGQSSDTVGAMEDAAVTTSREHLIIGCINQDYSLVMSIARLCPPAQALYIFRQAIAELKKEI